MQLHTACIPLPAFLQLLLLLLLLLLLMLRLLLLASLETSQSCC
jgi:hypothetical protein